MTNTPDSRRRIVYLLLVINAAFNVAFADWLPFERGIIGYDDSGTLTSLDDRGAQQLLDLSKRGSGSGFFVEIMNSAYGDGLEYQQMALGNESFPPYSLRPMVPILVGRIAGSLSVLVAGEYSLEGTKLNLLQPVMATVNALFMAFSFYAIFFSVKRWTQDTHASFLLALFALTGVGVIQTSKFFMLDVASYAIASGIILGFSTKRYWTVPVLIALGLLVKEVLVVYIALMILPILDSKSFSVRLRLVLISVVPIAVFVTIRILAGEDPLSVQYGWAPSQGDFRLNYLVGHLGSLGSVVSFLVRLSFGLGVPLILALLTVFRSQYRQKRKTSESIVGVVFMTVVANLLLASRVPRVMFVVYPVIAVLSAGFFSDAGVSEKALVYDS